MERKVFQVYNTSNTNDNPSRTELLEWVNKRLLSKFNLVEELCTGAAHCQLMDILFPKTVAMKNVKFMTNVEKDFLQNFRILQVSFDKVGVKQAIPVDKLIKGRFLDNLRFLQFFRKLYKANLSSGREEEYDAMTVRKGAPMGFGPAVVVNNPARPGPNQRVKLPVKPTTRSDRALTSIPKDNGPLMKINPRLSVDQHKKVEKSNSVDIKKNNDPESSQLRIIPNRPELCSPDCQKEIHQLSEKIQGLADEVKCMEELVRRSQIVSNFYHSKCRDVETLCRSHDKQGGTLSCDQIYEIIYATADGFEIPDYSLLGFV